VDGYVAPLNNGVIRRIYRLSANRGLTFFFLSSYSPSPNFTKLPFCHHRPRPPCGSDNGSLFPVLASVSCPFFCGRLFRFPSNQSGGRPFLIIRRLNPKRFFRPPLPPSHSVGRIICLSNCLAGSPLSLPRPIFHFTRPARRSRIGNANLSSAHFTIGIPRVSLFPQLVPEKGSGKPGFLLTSSIDPIEQPFPYLIYLLPLSVVVFPSIRRR